MATLSVISQVLQGQTFALDGNYLTIGREPDNTIHLDHTSVSKHHAMLTVENGDFKLRDLHSTNGIVVNGQPTVLTHLKDGDQIVLGDIELRFQSNGQRATPVSPSPPLADSKPAAPPTPPAVVETKLVITPTLKPSSERLAVKPSESDKRDNLPPPITGGATRTGIILPVSVSLGVLLLIGGSAFDANSMRFLGILLATAGSLGVLFRLRYGNIVAPPRKKL